MKKILLLPLLVVISACHTIPVTYKFPQAPEELLAECGPLRTIDKDVVYLSEYTKTVVENYKKYHNCASIVEAWKNWHSEQKKIFDSATKK